MIFLKLGGSAITDKTHEATAQADVIRRIAREINQARDRLDHPALVLGHGSGSFGHYAARKFGFGKNWEAYAETGASAARLNRIVADIFLAEGVPAVSIQPSASAVCRDGALVTLAVGPIRTALAHDLVPLVYGDVSFDETRGMTICSTEMIFAYLAPILKPSRILVSGIVDGVFTADPQQSAAAELIRQITPANFREIEAQLRGSHGVDVTGGMLAKVKTMLALVEREPAITVCILSALKAGLITQALVQEDFQTGTIIRAT